MPAAEYLVCPYCGLNKVKSSTPSATLGKFRIMAVSDGMVFILKCLKCGKPHRRRVMGGPLLWADMTIFERRVFNVEKWVKEALEDNEKGIRMGQ